jgi:hypothetical protein
MRVAYVRSPHKIPWGPKSVSSVVEAQQVRIDPYIWGINPSRVYVKAHQQTTVIATIRMVDRKIG